MQRLALINFCVNVGWIFLATWMPTYLIQVHGKSESAAGLYTSFTAASGMAGCLCGGIATDWLVRRVGLRWLLRSPDRIEHSIQFDVLDGHHGTLLRQRCLVGRSRFIADRSSPPERNQPRGEPGHRWATGLGGSTKR